MVLLSVLLLPALILMPATDVKTMLMIDLPLCIGTTGSLGAFYSLAEIAQGRPRFGALRRLPALIMLGAGSRRTSRAPCSRGSNRWRVSSSHAEKRLARGALPRHGPRFRLIEVGLGLLSMSAWSPRSRPTTGSATPFAMLFTCGYGYVALLVASEQAVRWREARALGESAAALRELAVPASTKLRGAGCLDHSGLFRGLGP